MWNPKLIVLLCGKSNSGKDFLYSHRHDFDLWFRVINVSVGLDSPNSWYSPEILPLFERYSFAQYLKEIVGVPIDRRLYDSERIDVLKKAFEMKVSHGNNVFVDYIINRIRQEKPEYVMITDYRFPNEYNEFCKQFPGSEIKIVQVRNATEPTEEPKECRSSLNPEDFIAETSLDSTLYHYYTLRRLHKNV